MHGYPSLVQIVVILIVDGFKEKINYKQKQEEFKRILDIAKAQLSSNRSGILTGIGRKGGPLPADP